MTHKTLGILGGGQLGRMSAQAAEKLGIRTVIFTPEPDSPASQIAEETIVADYTNQSALSAFSEKIDVISYEFENIPVETIQYLKTLKPVYPDEHLLEVAQDRVKEKSFLNSIKIDTARWAAPQTPEDIEKTLTEWSAHSCILKTTRFGYDGKGQWRISSASEIETIWIEINNQPIIIEEIVDFDFEISVIVARDKDGHMEFYGPALNAHKNHILYKSTVPAPVSPTLADKALQMTGTLAKSVDLRGVLALELFVTKDGALLANEIAPRTHNSGHWSIDACAVSQFENHVRAVCGLPILPPDRHSDCEMINLIGEDVHHLESYRQDKNACIHLYGKHDVKPGRKMGHVTILKEKNDAYKG